MGVRLRLENGAEDRRAGIARECQPARGHLVEHAAEAEEVRAGIERLTPRLFGGHVRHRSHRYPRSRQVFFIERRCCSLV